MYQAVCDKLTLEIRENLALRAEVIALVAEVARLNGELGDVFVTEMRAGRVMGAAA
jgi:hypothetical protein